MCDEIRKKSSGMSSRKEKSDVSESCILYSLHHPLLLKGEEIKTEIQDEDEPGTIINIRNEVFKNCRPLLVPKYLLRLLN